MRYAVLGDGKRIRPAVCMLATKTLGRDPRRAIGPAAALEMIHAYSLVHDDLPCMDDGQERRGKPATHVAFGEAMAVLAGDGLLTEAFGLLATSALPDSVRVRCLATLAKAAGIAGMVGGQAIDIYPQSDLDTVDGIEMLHSAKTGSLFECAAEMGAIAAGADDWQIQALWAFGSSLGSLFQVTDDLLDWQEDEPAEAGGPESPSVNIVTRIGPMAAHERAQRLFDQAVESLKDLDGTAELEALAAMVLRRRA